MAALAVFHEPEKLLIRTVLGVVTWITRVVLFASAVASIEELVSCGVTRCSLLKSSKSKTIAGALGMTSKAWSLVIITCIQLATLRYMIYKAYSERQYKNSRKIRRKMMVDKIECSVYLVVSLLAGIASIGLDYADWMLIACLVDVVRVFIQHQICHEFYQISLRGYMGGEDRRDATTGNTRSIPISDSPSRNLREESLAAQESNLFFSGC